MARSEKWIIDHDHPMAGSSGRILKHRYIAAEKLGRPLTRDEVVHHINGDHFDNRPENLRVMTNSEHVSLHWQQQTSPHTLSPKAGKVLQRYRKTLSVSQTELAKSLGYSAASHISRREAGEILMTRAELAEAIFAMERIVEERIAAVDPVEALEEASQ